MITDILNVLNKDAEMRPVVLGHIKIGGKSLKEYPTQGGKTYRRPERYDSFVITTMNRDNTGNLIRDESLMAQLMRRVGQGEKLTEIPIRVLSDDIEDIMQTSIVWYGGKRVGARSDGKTVTWFNSGDPRMFDNIPLGRILPKPVTMDWNDNFLKITDPRGNKIFKFHSNFNCVIAAQEARWGGVYRFRTSSVISLRQLSTSLMHLSNLTGGILVNMPLVLVVRPVQVNPKDAGGKEVTSTVYVVHVELRGADMKQIQDQAIAAMEFRVRFAKRIEETGRQYRKLLSAPGTESPDEAAEISEEFNEPETELETVPEDTSYGLIDQAPAKIVPADEELPKEQGRDIEIHEKTYEETKEPSETKTVEQDEQHPPAAGLSENDSTAAPSNGDKSGPAGDPPMSDEDNLAGSWKKCHAFLLSEALKLSPNLDPARFGSAIGVKIVGVGRVNAEDHIKLSDRKAWLKEIRDNKMAF